MSARRVRRHSWLVDALALAGWVALVLGTCVLLVFVDTGWPLR